MPSRSAKTGQYVSPSYAKKHPSTTVNERPPAPAKAKPSPAKKPGK